MAGATVVTAGCPMARTRDLRSRALRSHARLSSGGSIAHGTRSQQQRSCRFCLSQLF